LGGISHEPQDKYRAKNGLAEVLIAKRTGFFDSLNY
jgi:hypothetical protein